MHGDFDLGRPRSESIECKSSLTSILRVGLSNSVWENQQCIMMKINCEVKIILIMTHGRSREKWILLPSTREKLSHGAIGDVLPCPLDSSYQARSPPLEIEVRTCDLEPGLVGTEQHYACYVPAQFWYWCDDILWRIARAQREA